MKQINITSKCIIAFFLATILFNPIAYAIKSGINKTEIISDTNISLSKELEKKVNRKLSFSEKMGLKLLNKRTKKMLTRIISDNDECSIIVMKNGDIIEVKLIEVTSKKAKYKRCNKDENLEFNIDKSEILTIQTADGEVIYRNSNQHESNIKHTKQKKNGLAITSMVLGILSLLFSFAGLGLLMAILGIIFGAVARMKIRKNPKEFSGKKMAAAGLICGIIAIAIISLVIAAILAAV